MRLLCARCHRHSRTLLSSRLPDIRAAEVCGTLLRHPGRHRPCVYRDRVCHKSGIQTKRINESQIPADLAFILDALHDALALYLAKMLISLEI